jgi:hypothetical protein
LKKLLLTTIVTLPLFPQNPPPALLTGLGQKVSQEVVKTVSFSCSDIRAASCFSDFIRAADGGNKYDNKGNLYLSGGTAVPAGAQAIQMMEPSGQFSNIAVLADANLTCTDTSGGAVTTGKNIVGFAFNPGIMSLSVVTTNTVLVNSGTCAAPSLVTSLSQTIALLRLR